MDVLVIGFGNMGCRHAQSLLTNQNVTKIVVIEPDEQMYHTNCGKIGVDPETFIHYRRIDEINEHIDVAVVATPAKPRFEITRQLIKKGVKRFILEKVVFQSEKQFQEIIQLLEDHDAVAHCNFVNRYFENYQKLKRGIDGANIKMIVSGGDFGLACNGLHYIDLFSYVTGQEVSLENYLLEENPMGNKRGSDYREVMGQMKWITDDGSILYLSSNGKRQGGMEISVLIDDQLEIINEQARTHITFGNEQINVNEFHIRFTSQLTSNIIDDLLENSILLPSVQDTFGIHTQFFNALNKVFNISKDANCPIT